MMACSKFRWALGFLGRGMLPFLLYSSAVFSQEQPEAASYQEPPIATLDNVPLTCSSLQVFVAQSAPALSRLRKGETEDLRIRRIFDEWVLHLTLIRETQASPISPDLETTETRLRRKILGQAFLHELNQNLRLDPKEAELFFQSHPERFRREKSIATRWILRKLPSEASAEHEKEARILLEDLRRQVLEGASFGALARLHSEAENANRGGAVAASPRGSLLEEYETAAWSLKSGQLSPVVRLPHGLALIRLEKIFPPMSRTLEESRSGIEARLLQQKSQALLKQTLEGARIRWPITLDLEHDRIRFLGETLTLDALGLGHHPPRLEEKIAASMQSRWLELLALEANLKDRPAIAQRLAFQKDLFKASRVIDRVVQAEIPEVPETHLRALFQKRHSSLREPEQRTFEVIIVRGEEGAMRQAQVQARTLGERWKQGGPWSAPAVERWGPLTQQQLGASTSPRLAKAAFALDIGAVSDPNILENYNLNRIQFEAEGYAILRLIHREPQRSLSYGEVQDRLRQDATRRVEKALRKKVRSRILADSSVLVQEAAFNRCFQTLLPRQSGAIRPAE